MNGEIAGWFGKIPALGDFASRRLPSSFVAPWDDWLSVELSDAQGAYELAPIVCFAVGEVTVDAHAWCGILLPSVDRVGRRFPLTLAWALAEAAASLPGPPWWTALTAAGCLAASGGCGVEGLEASLMRLPAPGTAPDHPDISSAQAFPGRGRSAWWPWAIDGTPGAAAVLALGLPRAPRFREIFGLTQP